MEVQKDVFMCFVDYEKDFDNVEHLDLFNMIKAAGLDGKNLSLTRN